MSVALAYFRRRPGRALMAALLLLIVLLAVFAPLAARYDPLRQDLAHQFAAPSPAHLFGTDEFGRDLFSRTVYGARISLLTALAAVLIAAVVGVPLGLVAGYFGRWVDVLAMRFIDVLLAIPAILVAMGLIAILGRSTINAMVAVGIVNIPAFARITRASTLTVKELDFVAATRTMGAGYAHLLARTILPNVVGPIFVQMSVTAAIAILLEAALSFLGLGTQPPTPSWGAMLSVGKGYLSQAPWYGLFPGVALTLTVLALDSIAKTLQDLLAARTRMELGL